MFKNLCLALGVVIAFSRLLKLKPSFKTNDSVVTSEDVGVIVFVDVKGGIHTINSTL